MACILEMAVILIPSRALSFPEALRPPVEAGGGADQIWTGLEGDAALSLRVLEVVDRGEMAGEQGRVGERPEVLGRLELRRIRRQEEQIDVFRHRHTQAGRFPARTVEDEHDFLSRPPPPLAGAGGPFDPEQRAAPA